MSHIENMNCSQAKTDKNFEQCQAGIQSTARSSTEVGHNMLDGQLDYLILATESGL